jgi:hypothetical protein
VTFFPWVDFVAGIELSEAGTTIFPMSLPNEVCEFEPTEKPLRKEGGMNSTKRFFIESVKFNENGRG